MQRPVATYQTRREVSGVICEVRMRQYLVKVELEVGREEELDVGAFRCNLGAGAGGLRVSLDVAAVGEGPNELDGPDLEDLEMRLNPLGIVLELALSVLLSTLREEEEGAFGNSCWRARSSAKFTAKQLGDNSPR